MNRSTFDDVKRSSKSASLLSQTARLSACLGTYGEEDVMAVMSLTAGLVDSGFLYAVWESAEIMESSHGMD